MSATCKTKPPPAKKSKYALVFFHQEQTKSVVSVSDILGEPIVGEIRTVKWTPDESHPAKIVLLGKNNSALLSRSNPLLLQVIMKYQCPRGAQLIG